MIYNIFFNPKYVIFQNSKVFNPKYVVCLHKKQIVARFEGVLFLHTKIYNSYFCAAKNITYFGLILFTPKGYIIDYMYNIFFIFFEILRYHL